MPSPEGTDKGYYELALEMITTPHARLYEYRVLYFAPAEGGVRSSIDVVKVVDGIDQLEA